MWVIIDSNALSSQGLCRGIRSSGFAEMGTTAKTDRRNIRAAQRTPAGRGQDHRAREPIEQLLLQLLFQLTDLLAERRLRHMFASDEPAEVGIPLAACETASRRAVSWCTLVAH
jgi:hypothetical protein